MLFMGNGKVQDVAVGAGVEEGWVSRSQRGSGGETGLDLESSANMTSGRGEKKSEPHSRVLHE